MSSLYGSQGGRGPTGQFAQGGRGGTGNIGGYKQAQLPNFTPEQMELFRNLLSQLSPESYTGRLAGGDQSLFEESEAPALRQFSGLQGGLASRFSAGGVGKGALSSRQSSGFQNASTSGASNFAQELQSRRQDLQRQAIKDLFGMGESLLGQRPYENFLLPKKKSFLEELFGGLAPGIGGGIGRGIGKLFGL